MATLMGVSVVFLFPLWWMLTTSLKPLAEAVRVPPTWIPEEIRWENYKEAIYGPVDLLLCFRNSTLLCFLNVVGMVMSCALVAYGFARLSWPGRDLLFAITLATLMIPQPVLLIPLYQLFRDLGWIGTFKPLWVPAFFAAPYNIFLLRQFFLSLPKDLSDSARIDGCSEWRIFWQIILPLSRPALLVVGLFTFIFVWNDFIQPLIYLTEPDMFTLALGLHSFQSALGGTEVHLLMAAATIMVAPVIVLFLLTQKTFIEGIALTGLKG